MQDINIQLKIKTLRYGQPRSYADSSYEYEIEVEGMSEYQVKAYCTNVLRPCSQARDQWNKDDMHSYFSGYYEFKKLDENKYSYYVLQPYTD